MIRLNPKSQTPLWEQIRDGFKNQILLGVWAPGEQLPSVRVLSAELGINPNTIQRAMSELEREGLTYTVVGKGAFVEDDLSLITLKRQSEAMKKLDSVLKELKASGVRLSEIEKKLYELYKEELND